MKFEELPLFSFERLANATDKFDVANKLEQGGFGPVYKFNSNNFTLWVVMTQCSGYMSPEYAMEGRFSEKSDVFSFGILLLEIVSGRKNTSFYHDEHSLSLLGFVTWKLWNEDGIVMLIDPTISDPCFEVEILRYIHVGLLCVQEFTRDRLTISTALSMFSSEIANLPTPKQPTFTEKEILPNKSSPANVTVTVIEGR
ncbi:G-type lectin S-receptor-like serine/threonine-protein kinase At1g11300 [Cornus florida]|uniref:G-type lectin S-receptor-like serine/threonine-protein kinase At1g11300 n=1 Tax=Cornus florida TaxID=4283 RepID=UPI00289D9706|nr:G-type lectin S-receptor-like serine/threonine-protein kinase At1g11300 [Cornus florida]